MFSLMQRAHDRLVQMLDQVRERAPVMPGPRILIAAVDAFLLGGEGDDETALEEAPGAQDAAPVAPPTETEAAPQPAAPEQPRDTLPAPAAPLELPAAEPAEAEQPAVAD